MLKVKNYLDISGIHGIGLFAEETIEIGQIIWEPGFEQLYTAEEFENLSEAQKKFVENWGWKDKQDGLHHLSLDNDRFMNHSSTPNTLVEESGLTVAIRRINYGQEIVCDYSQFEAEFRFDQYDSK